MLCPTETRAARLLMIPFGTSAAEGMDRPGASHRFTAMPDPLRDEVLLTSSDGDPFAINDQRITALHNDKVFIVVMDMRRGYRGLVAGPECHLTPIHSVKNIALHPRSRLTARCDLVCGTLHKAWEIIHRLSFNSTTSFNVKHYSRNTTTIALCGIKVFF